MAIDTNIFIGITPLFRENCTITPTSKNEIISNIGEQTFNNILSKTTCKVLPTDYYKRDIHLQDMKKVIQSKNLVDCKSVLSQPTGEQDLKIVAEALSGGDTEFLTYDHRLRLCINSMYDKTDRNIIAKIPIPPKGIFRGTY